MADVFLDNDGRRVPQPESTVEFVLFPDSDQVDLLPFHLVGSVHHHGRVDGVAHVGWILYWYHR